MRSKPRSRGHDITIGLVMVVLGAIFLADQVIFYDAFGRYWPVLLIVLGIGNLFSRERRNRVPWLLVVGVIMLLHTTDVLRLGDSWPLFIVAAGLGFMWNGWYGDAIGPDGKVICCPKEDDDDR